jgi:hypothetical protein
MGVVGLMVAEAVIDTSPRGSLLFLSQHDSKQAGMLNSFRPVCLLIPFDRIR